ncbi:phage protease [Pandoraea fibrosis]|uniref:Mu-like prophage FluMu I protein n=1 Tax=Pandoraea fibrosis TaxID=1891094 RepID=A0A5E4XG89_9BURK|nr:phage protease [Pandoraea fibrosis]VVE35286.1 Mu-like prophage FluMu I protein [Pandoraea fibrosis]
MPIAYAFLTNDTPLDGASVQLLPIGAFRAQDGRPGTMTDGRCTEWTLTPERANKIVSARAARKNKFLLDYEHATLTNKGKGEPAPAAGWGEQLVARDDGLYVDGVEWTPRAAGMIANKEYRYSSPVFSFDSATGEVIDVVMCGITNDPALDGMDELHVALTALRMACNALPQEDLSMEPLLERLRWLLNLPIASTADDIIRELDKLKAQLEGEAQAAASFDLLSYLSQRTETSATEPDPAKYVPIESLAAAQSQLATVSTALRDYRVADVIATATNEGRLLGEADATWARSFAIKHGCDALKEALNARQPVAALTGTQTGGKAPVSPTGSTLSAEESEVAKTLGIDEKSFAAARL